MALNSDGAQQEPEGSVTVSRVNEGNMCVRQNEILGIKRSIAGERPCYFFFLFRRGRGSLAASIMARILYSYRIA